MPRVAELPTPVAESSGVGALERQAPLSNGLVGDRDAALGEKVFHVPETQVESKVQSNGVRDDVSWESISVVARCEIDHPVTLISLTST